MKKHFLAVSIAGLFITPMAIAQSSITVFGIADAAVRHVDNEGRGSISSLVSGSNSTSRIGFRGVEDLGGGMSARLPPRARPDARRRHGQQRHQILGPAFDGQHREQKHGRDPPWPRLHSDLSQLEPLRPVLVCRRRPIERLVLQLADRSDPLGVRLQQQHDGARRQRCPVSAAEDGWPGRRSDGRRRRRWRRDRRPSQAVRRSHRLCNQGLRHLGGNDAVGEQPDHARQVQGQRDRRQLHRSARSSCRQSGAR